MFNITDLPNITAWIYGLVPTIYFTWLAWHSRGEPWRYSVLISGVFLIIIGAYMAGLFIDLLAIIDEIKDTGKITTEKDINIFKELKTSGAIWLAILPPLSAGLGINFVSEFILSRKPEVHA